MGYNPLLRGANPVISSRQTSTGYQNGISGAIGAAVPVSTNNVGNIVLMDVTDESIVSTFVGLTHTSISNGGNGQVVSDGRCENIPSALGFSIGDVIYVGAEPGTLTNIKPDIEAIGWSAGMFVVFVGVVVKNEFISGAKDIQLARVLVGQL